MIEVFQTTDNVYDPNMSLTLEYNQGCSTRGNKYKLVNQTCHSDLRKYFFFSARIVNIWNSLPNYVGDVNTVNQFKACLPYDTIRREMLF